MSPVRRLRARWSIPVLATGTFLMACSGSSNGDAVAAEAVTDSAGVRIVSNGSTGTWTENEQWTLTELLQVGSMMSEPEYQFGSIGGLDRDADGNLYVLDAQAQEVRVFDSEGTFVRAIGSPGQGPGEIGQGVTGIFLTSDGLLLIPDLGNGRISRFTLDGESLPSVPLSIESGIPLRWDLDASGKLVMQRRSLAFDGDIPTGFGGEGDPILVVGGPGEESTTLFILPVGGTTIDFSGGLPSFRLFEPEPVWDLAPSGRFVSGVNSSLSLEVRDATGEVVQIIRKDMPTRPVTELDKEAIFGIMRTAVVDQGLPPEAADLITQGIGFAENYPAFAGLQSGPDNTILVQGFITAEELAGIPDALENFSLDPQALGASTWDVFSSEGVYLGGLAMPDRFTPLVFKEDIILGVWKDELGVSYARVLQIQQ